MPPNTAQEVIDSLPEWLRDTSWRPSAPAKSKPQPVKIAKAKPSRGHCKHPGRIVGKCKNCPRRNA